MISRRIFIEVSCLRALAGTPPQKFSRAFDNLRHVLPQAIPVLIKGGDLFEAPPFFDKSYDDRSRTGLGGPPTRKITIADLKSLALIAIARFIVRVSTASQIGARARRMGAYELSLVAAALNPQTRAEIVNALHVADDLECHASLRYWLRTLERATPPFVLGELVEPMNNDVIIFLGFCGGVNQAEDVKILRSRSGCQVILVLVDAIALSQPIACGIQTSEKIAKTLQIFADISCKILVAHDEAFDLVCASLRGVGDKVERVSPPSGLPLSGPQELPKLIGQSSGWCHDTFSFVLSIGSFKDRRDICLLLAAYLEAREARPELGLLLLVSRDGLGVGFDKKPCDTQGYLVRDVWQAHPEKLALCEAPNDAQLRWLLSHAAFIIQPPASHGLGLAACEAKEFGKICVRERPRNLTIEPIGCSEIFAGQSVAEWVDAIIGAHNLCSSSPTSPAMFATKDAQNRFGEAVLDVINSLE